MEEPRQEQSTLFKIKAFVFVEAVALVVALVLPVTPSKSGKPVKWPPTWSDYFQDVLLSFVLVNALLLLLFVAGWVYARHLKKRPRSEIRDPGSRE